jgi:hypothetical protein
MHYSDRDVNNAIDQFRAGGEPLPPDVFQHLTPAQLQRWECALQREEMRIMREWEQDWWANGGEMPPHGIWYWQDSCPNDVSSLTGDDVA